MCVCVCAVCITKLSSLNASSWVELDSSIHYIMLRGFYVLARRSARRPQNGNTRYLDEKGGGKRVELAPWHLSHVAMLSNATRCHWWPVDDEVQVGNRNRKWNGNGNENGARRNRNRNDSKSMSFLSTVRLWQPLYGLPPFLLWGYLSVCVCCHCDKHAKVKWQPRGRLLRAPLATCMTSTSCHPAQPPFATIILPTCCQVQLEELFTFDLAHWLAPSAKFAFRLCTARLAQRPLLITNLQLAASNRKLATSKLASSIGIMCHHPLLGLICRSQLAAFCCRCRLCSKFKASCWQLPLLATFASITLHFYCRETATASSPDGRCWQRRRWPGYRAGRLGQATSVCTFASQR